MSEQPWKPLILEVVLVAVVGTLLLTGVLVYMDNTNYFTTNGLWKSLSMAPWVEWAPGKKFQTANVLYYPINGLLIRCLPEEVFGPIWRRMAFVNSAYGGLALGFLYMLLRGLGFSRAVGLIACLFQLGCAFFLGHGITSEDVMPGVTFLFAAIGLAVFVARRPTYLGIAAVGAVFSIAWLFEWRLQVQHAPAFLAALVALPADFPTRLKRLAAACGGVLVLPSVSALLVVLLGNSTRDFFQMLVRILWVKKGGGTGYGGFASSKVVFMLNGMGEHLVGGRNVQSLDWIATNWLDLVCKLAVIGALGVVFCLAIRRRWHDPAFRTAGILLGGAFLFGQFFNLYVQPQDPQFQVNVMMWLPLAWAFVCTARLPERLGVSRVALTAGMAVVTLVLPVLNVVIMSERRGEDSRQLARVEKLARSVDTDVTVFLQNGFEGLITWQAVTWDWHQPDLRTAPQPEPRYKYLFLLGEATVYPTRTPQQSAESVRSQIDDALKRGFQVVVNNLWDFDVTRDEGLELVRKYDDEFPRNHHEEHLEYLDLSEAEFTETIDKHRDPQIWEQQGNQWVLRHPPE